MEESKRTRLGRRYERSARRGRVVTMPHLIDYRWGLQHFDLTRCDVLSILRSLSQNANLTHLYIRDWHCLEYELGLARALKSYIHLLYLNPTLQHIRLSNTNFRAFIYDIRKPIRACLMLLNPTLESDDDSTRGGADDDSYDDAASSLAVAAVPPD